jgi:GntR family transcriptional repressor for pyruvate dehydrogenase complex
VIGQVFREPVVEIISRHQKATSDYLEFRREIDGLAADYAARRATLEDRALIGDIIHRMEAAHAKDDFREEAEIDVELHNAIGESAHNMILLHTLRACYRLLTEGVFYNRSVVYALPGARDKLLDQHRAIASAVLAGDAQAARKAAEAHMDFVAEAMRVANQTDDWRRVSRLRMRQRNDETRNDKERAAE